MKLINGPSNFYPAEYYLGSVINFRNGQNDSVSLGSWLWNGSFIKNQDTERAYYADIDTIFAFLILNNINELYVSANSLVNSPVAPAGKLTFAEFGVFVNRCYRYGIKVDALLDNTGSWLNNQTPFYNYINLISQYQTQAAPTQKLRAVHLDFEPHISYNLDEHPEIVAKFAEFISKHAYPAISGLNMQFGFSIPHWYTNFNVTDGGQTMTLSELVFKYCNYVSIMSYWDTATGIYTRIEDEIVFAKKYNRRLNASIESIYTEEGPGLSFAEDGKGVMAAQMTLLRQMLDNVEGLKFGLSVHHVYTWYALQE